MNKNRKQEWILAAFIVAEIVLFSFTGRNFFSQTNFFECIRLGVEIGLLALALTPVIVTGGIDLSVGSMMGLCAVTFGALWSDAHFSIAAAVAVALLVSLVGGALNALLISRMNVSPLIVTLGTFSLFRGIAEGITAGARNYSGFPAHFLYLGQGYLGGVVPPQTLLLVLAAVGFYFLLQRSTIGRGVYAMGHSAEGARYAAVPVGSRLMLVYILSGLAAGVAAIVYVAHLGQAKSDAGTGYELIAITAVVLGGTSIYGGSGTIVGTLMGLAAIVVLQNGLRLSAWPTELAGISTGTLLILTIAIERWASNEDRTPTSRRTVSLLAGIAALIVLGVFFFRSPQSTGESSSSAVKRVTVAVMPKAKGDPYFISCKVGAEEAAQALNVDLIWDGPTGLDAAKQNELVQGWITRRVDAISVAVENAPGISTVLRQARAQGIKVVTWDADAEPDARDFFINQATAQSIGYSLADETARVLHSKGDFAIITGALSAANQNRWMDFIRRRIADKYPGLKLVAVRPSDDDRDKAFAEAQTLMKVYPNVKILLAISAPAVPGAGEAVRQAGRKDSVQVIGLSLPNLCKPYVHGGEVEAVALWNTKDLGYAAVSASAALARGTLQAGAASFNANRLGPLEIKGSDIILGAPLLFRKDNIDRYNF